MPGDLALVRDGPDHFIAHEPGARCVLPGKFRSLSADDDALSNPGGAVFLCGAYRFAGDIGRGLVATLPPVLSLPASVDDPIHRVVTLRLRCRGGGRDLRVSAVHVGRDGRQTPSVRSAWTPTCCTCSSSWSPSSLW